MQSIAWIGNGPGETRSLFAFPEAEPGHRAEARPSGIFPRAGITARPGKTPARSARDLDQARALRPGTQEAGLGRYKPEDDACPLLAFPEAEPGSRAGARLAGIFAPRSLAIAVALEQRRVRIPALRALNLVPDQARALRPGTQQFETGK